jgi:hypothetical protein
MKLNEEKPKKVKWKVYIFTIFIFLVGMSGVVCLTLEIWWLAVVLFLIVAMGTYVLASYLLSLPV